MVVRQRWVEAQAETTKQAECSQCGCVYSYQFAAYALEKRSPLRDADAAAERSIERQMKEGKHEGCCPACGYMPPSALLMGKVRAAFSLVFLSLIGLPVIMLVMAASRQASVLPPLIADLIVFAVLAAMVMMWVAAPVWGALYHPTRWPFSRWQPATKILRQKRTSGAPVAPSSGGAASPQPAASKIELTCPQCFAKYMATPKVAAKFPRCRKCNTALEDISGFARR